MTFDTMYDSAYPQTPAPATDAVLIYVGGDTPHPWTDAEIAAQPARYRLPTWVRSNPGSASIQADAEAMVQWLVGHAVPRGSATVLDLETAVDPTYVNGYGNILHNAGFLVLPYGSRSTLYQNPQLDGYFDAHPGDAEQVDPGNVATQYAYLSTIDLDVVSKTVPLWDTHPPVAPTTPTTSPAPEPPTSNSQEIIMGLPSNCSDEGAVRAQIREWWATFRTDALSVADQNILAYCYTIPVAEHGFGGNPDAMLANLLDGAKTAGLLRPEYAGAA